MLDAPLDRDGVVDFDGDADNDGILDGIERLGYDSDPAAPGVEVPLHDWGSKEDVPDVFVEIDAVERFEPDRPETRFDNAREGFAAKGLQLHVDAGPHHEFDPAQQSGNSNRVASAAGSIADTFGTTMEVFGGEFETARDGLQLDGAPAFDPDRRPFFRYALFGRAYDGGGTSGGLATVGGSQIYVNAQNTSGRNQGVTFWHELGHSLTLRHGGDEVDNLKPNYLSIMNYHYQLARIPLTAGGLREDFSSREMPTLTNGALTESEGITGGDAATEFYLASEGCYIDSPSHNR